MFDRLAQLRRQRALAQEQLEWINREIAEAETRARENPGPTAGLSGEKLGSDSTVAASTPSAAPTTPSAAEEAIIAPYRVAPEALNRDVRKGCLLYFFAALLLLAVGVAILYFSFRAR